MNFCIAVFRSGTQVMELVEALERSGIACEAVNTPSSAHVGCGISARFYCAHRGFAREIIERKGLNTFVGFYKIERQGVRTQVVRM